MLKKLLLISFFFSLTNTLFAQNASSYCPNLTRFQMVGYSDATTAGETTKLQIFLKRYFNLNDQEYISSGYFGYLTKKHVMNFQNQNNLIVTGMVGQVTRSKIAQVCSGANNNANSYGACSFNNLSIPNGSSTLAYQLSTNADGQCVTEIRTCNNGNLSGTYTYSTCPVTSVTSQFSASPLYGNAPLTVNFNLNAITGSFPAIEFGDGSLEPVSNANYQTSKTVTHTYNTVGNYTAKFLLSGIEEIGRFIINVTSPTNTNTNNTNTNNTGGPEITAFNTNISGSVTSGQSVNLTWISTNSISCNISGTGLNSTTVPTVSGIYVTPTQTSTYTLTCTNGSQSANKTVTVEVTTTTTQNSSSDPFNTITASPSNGNTQAPITFTSNKISNLDYQKLAQQGVSNKYKFDYGDGVTENAIFGSDFMFKNSHTYSSNGTYTVKLLNPQGQTIATTVVNISGQNVTVNSPYITITPSTGNAPLSVNVYALVYMQPYANAVRIDYGDGKAPVLTGVKYEGGEGATYIAQINATSAYYLNPGTYTIKILHYTTGAVLASAQVVVGTSNQTSSVGSCIYKNQTYPENATVDQMTCDNSRWRFVYKNSYFPNLFSDVCANITQAESLNFPQCSDTQYNLYYFTSPRHILRSGTISIAGTISFSRGFDQGYTISWGDGTTTTVPACPYNWCATQAKIEEYGLKSHTYANPGNYEIVVTHNNTYYAKNWRSKIRVD